nr:PREDICTED: proteoglycan 4-like [Megachile rotundata]
MRREMESLRREVAEMVTPVAICPPSPPRPTEPEPTPPRKRRASQCSSPIEEEQLKRRATEAEAITLPTPHEPCPEEDPVLPEEVGQREEESPRNNEVAQLTSLVTSLAAMVRDLTEEVRGKKGQEATRPREAPSQGRREQRRDGTPAPPLPRPQQERPKTSTAPAPETWANVVGRKAKRVQKKQAVATASEAAPPAAATTRLNQKPKPQRKKPAPKKKAQVPKAHEMAALTLTIPKGGKTTYSEAMRKAVETVPSTEIQQLGITEFKVKKSATGGMILRVPGPDGHQKVAELVRRLQPAFEGGQRCGFASPRGPLKCASSDSTTPRRRMRSRPHWPGLESAHLRTYRLGRSRGHPGAWGPSG